MNTHDDLLLSDASPEVARDLLAKVDVPPEALPALSVLGRRLVRDRRYAEAGAVFEFLTFLDGSNAYSHRSLGLCCERTDRLGAAERCFTRALEIDPDDARAWAGRRGMLMALQIWSGRRWSSH